MKKANLQQITEKNNFGNDKLTSPQKMTKIYKGIVYTSQANIFEIRTFQENENYQIPNLFSKPQKQNPKCIRPI